MVSWRASASCLSSPTPSSSLLPLTSSHALFTPTSTDLVLDKVEQRRGEWGLGQACALIISVYFEYCIHWFFYSSGVWWVTSTPVSQCSGYLTLRRDHSPGQPALSCWEKMWSIAGSVSALVLLGSQFHWILDHFDLTHISIWYRGGKIWKVISEPSVYHINADQSNFFCWFL